MEEISVHWINKGEKLTGKLIFEKILNVVFIKLQKDNEEVLTREVVLDETANKIKKEIKTKNFDITGLSFA